jgi:hypothetical protein
VRCKRVRKPVETLSATNHRYSIYYSSVSASIDVIYHANNFKLLSEAKDIGYHQRVTRRSPN